MAQNYFSANRSRSCGNLKLTDKIVEMRKRGGTTNYMSKNSINVNEVSILDLLNLAYERVSNLKGKSQELSSDFSISRENQDGIKLQIEEDFEKMSKMLVQRKSQMLFGVDQIFSTYQSAIEDLILKCEKEMTIIDETINSSQNAEYAKGLSIAEFDQKTVELKEKFTFLLQEPIVNEIEIHQIKSICPTLSYHSKHEEFAEVLEGCGWVEHAISSSNIRTIIDQPATSEKSKEIFKFLPIDIVSGSLGGAYVLDIGKESGYIHLFFGGDRRELIQLSKQTNLKKTPHSIAISDKYIYISYPESNLVAGLPQTENQQVELLTSQKIGLESPGLNEPHGLCCDDTGCLIIADKQNDRIVILKPNHIYRSQIKGPVRAPLIKPNSIAITNNTHLAVLHGGACSVHIYSWSTLTLLHRTCTFQPPQMLPTTETWFPTRLDLFLNGVDKDLEVVITACYNGSQSLIRYNFNKCILYRLGSTGNVPGKFNDLMGVNYNQKHKTLMVCDYGNERIQVFDV